MKNSVAEYVLWNQTAAKTGRIYISNGKTDGDIFIMNGSAVHAQTSDRYGLDAYLSILLDWEEPKLLAWEGQTLPQFQTLWLDHYSTMTLLSRFAHLQGDDFHEQLKHTNSHILAPHNRQIVSFQIDSPHLGHFTYDINREFFTVGRSESNELCIDDPSISRYHCYITSQEKHLFVHDLNSANGTYIENDPSYFGMAEEGQQIRFGNVTCKFKILPMRSAEEKRQASLDAQTTLIPKEVLQNIRNGQTTMKATATLQIPPAHLIDNPSVIKQKKTRPMTGKIPEEVLASIATS